MRHWILAAAVFAVSPLTHAEQPCSREKVAEVAGRTVWKSRDALVFTAGLQIDADGAPTAYSPDGKGLDHLANAGKPGNWWGVVTADGKPSGAPVVQGPQDPAPGYYVSSTSLEDATKARTDPRRYVDSSTIPYVVLPPALTAGKLNGGAKLGDLVVVINPKNRKVAYAIFADVGPKDKLGEGSIALAKALDVPADPKKGGTSAPLTYIVFPRSGNGKPRTATDIQREAEARLQAFGGAEHVSECAR